MKNSKAKLKTKPFKPKIIVILGSTASGKSELAIKIARIFNTEVISADSRQVYKGLDIGSGKITKKEMAGVPHHLLDVASPKRTFTVAQYQKLAKKALEKILAKNKLPIICGGTGFYIDALLHNYKLPAVAPRPKLRKQLEKKSAEELFRQLKKLDPRRAKNIDKNNRRRLIRALEIVISTKKPIEILQQAQDKKSYDFLKIGIKISPQELKRLIAERLKKRLNQGLIKEVKKLHNPPAGGGLSWQRLDDLGLEYRYVSRYLRGLINKKEMIDSILRESWQYVRRQMTWFKKDKEIIWVKNNQEAINLAKEFTLT